MNNTFNKKDKSSLAIFAIVAVIYALFFALIPFEKNAASWISFGFTFLSFIIGIGIYTYAFQNESLVSKVYGFPIFRIGLLYVAAQFVLGVIICFITALIEVVYWIPLLLYIVLLGAALIGIIAADNARDVIEQLDAQTEQVTKHIKMFNLDIQSTVAACTDETVKKELLKLADAIRYSDPVSSDATADTENMLFSALGVLNGFVIAKDTENALAQITRVTNLLNERNRICKAFKK